MKYRGLHIPGNDLFSPILIYPFFVSIFLLFGVFGLDIFSLSLFILFLASYTAGFLIARRYPVKQKRGYPLSCIVPLTLKIKIRRGGFPWIWKAGVPLIAIGIAAEIANIMFINSIPVLNEDMRSMMIPALTYVSFLIVPGCVIKSGRELMRGKPRHASGWFILSLFAITLLGYKTEIIALVFSMAIMLNYLGCLKGSGKGMGLLVLGMLAFFSISGITALRFSLTTGVFSSIVSKIGPLGITHGMMFQSIFSSLGIVPGPTWGPRGIISQMVGMGKVTTTPTILGIPYIDFGIIGVITTGLLLGFIFSRGYQILREGNIDILPLHAICMSFLILTIETGIADIIVILYLFVYLLMIISCWRAK